MHLLDARQRQLRLQLEHCGAGGGTARRLGAVALVEGEDAVELQLTDSPTSETRLASTSGTLPICARFSGLSVVSKWTASAAVACDALLWAHANGATSPATHLYLNVNKLTDACVPRLVEVLSAGAVPKLLKLDLDDNALSDAGKQSVKAAGEARGETATAAAVARAVVEGGARLVVTVGEVHAPGDRARAVVGGVRRAGRQQPHCRHRPPWKRGLWRGTHAQYTGTA